MERKRAKFRPVAPDWLKSALPATIGSIFREAADAPEGGTKRPVRRLRGGLDESNMPRSKEMA
jgi:hypothetical protein